MLLEAPAAPDGAGVTFSLTTNGAYRRSADFLVTVAASTTLRPLETASEAESATAPPPPESKYTTNTKASFDRALEHNVKGCHHNHPVSITPGSLRPPHERQECGVNGSVINEVIHIVGHFSTRRKMIEKGSGSHIISRRRIHHPFGSSALPELPLPAMCRASSPGATEDQKKSTSEAVEFGRTLAGLTGARRRQGPGPGGCLWVSSRNVCKRVTDTYDLPKRSKTRQLVKFLEARLKLQGQPDAGGLPGAPSQRIDMPYTKELAKWGYDDILGIPRTVAPNRG